MSPALSLGCASLPRYVPVRERPHSFTREPGNCVADDARRASPIKRAERGDGGHGGSSLPTFPLRFFSLVTFDSPTFALAVPSDARPRLRPSGKERENGKAHLYAAPFVPRRMREVSAHRGVTQPHDSPIR